MKVLHFINVKLGKVTSIHFQDLQHKMLYTWLVCVICVTHFKPCDWSTHFIGVILKWPDIDQNGSRALSHSAEFSKPVLQYRHLYSKACDCCVKKCIYLYK